MANDLTSTPNLWVLDSVGILSETPVWIKQIYFIPNANADDLVFKQWDENTTVAAGTKQAKTGTITLTNTLTSTGNLPSTIADGHVFELLTTSGASGNLGKKLVETAGDANAVIIHEDDWTNEASKVYSWTTYATTTAMAVKANSGDTSSAQLDFGEKGRRFPNLTLETIDGGTAYVFLRQF